MARGVWAWWDFAVAAELLVILADNDERINASWFAHEAALKAAETRYELFIRSARNTVSTTIRRPITTQMSPSKSGDAYSRCSIVRCPAVDRHTRDAIGDHPEPRVSQTAQNARSLAVRLL